MAYQPYSSASPIWSSEEYTPWSPPQEGFKNLAVSAALGAGAFGVAANTRVGKGPQGQSRFGIDLAQSHWRAFAERTPFSLLNTFRVSEFLSPFTSGAAKNLDVGKSVIDATKKVGFYEYGAEFTSTDETKQYLRQIIGEENFAKAGMDLSDFELRYEQDLNSRTGKLLSRRMTPSIGGKSTKGNWTVVSNKAALMETAPFEADVFEKGIHKGRHSTSAKVNTAFYSVLQSLGITDKWGVGSQTKADRLFANFSEGQFKSRKGFAPIPLEKAGAMGGAKLAASYAQVPLAFGMERFNRLLQGVIEQVPFLQNATPHLEKSLGMKLGVTSGKPLNMFLRYGGKAAKIGAGYAALQQVDWVRRNYSLPGEFIASGAVSATAAYLFNKVRKGGSPKAAFAVGVASFFGQVILPGFDQGVIEGIATTATKMHIAKSAIGAVTGMNTYRRTMEGFLPGISDWKTGALMGIGLGIMSMPDLFMRGGLTGKMLEHMSGDLRKSIGLGQSMINATTTDLPKSLSTGVGESLYKILRESPNLKDGTSPINSYLRKNLSEIEPFLDQMGIKGPEDLRTRRQRSKLYSYLYKHASSKGAGPVDGMLRELHHVFETATETRREELKNNNIVNKALAERLDDIGLKYQGDGNAAKIARGLHGFGAKFIHSLFGANMQGEALHGNQVRGEVGVLAKHGFKSRLGRVGTLFAGALAFQQLATGALLGSMEGPSELSAIYSGQKQVAVKRGRWWEGGGTPFEGAEVKYHRPHAYVAMMSRARQKSAWGENEDEISPIRKFFLKNFTYHIEKENYWDRPYPISGAAFEDVPVIGGLLSGTIGRLIKPAKLMHTSEYMREGPDGSIEFKHKPEIRGAAPGLGGKSAGVPYSPFSAGYIAGGMQHQFRELEGLTGWAKNMVQKANTGIETFGTQRPIMASAGSMTDPGEAFWDLNLGGGLFMTEPIRRFLPKKRGEIEEYNPLMNRMPYWLPDRFKHGDPYRLIDEGHLRLPGSGYEAINPALKGFSKEDYPDIFKMAILADVAPMSKEFKNIRQRLYTKRSEGITTDAENAMMDGVDRLYNERISRTFDRVDPNAIEVPLLSNITQGAQASAQKFIRKAVAPVEYMVPGGFRPVQKLMSDRDMIEEYQYQRMYGSQFAFWDKPIRDWFRPAFYSAIDFMDPLDIAGKPLWRREADEQQSFFDKLEFQKQMQLASMAQMQGRSGDQRFHTNMASQTRYGVNPQSDAMSIYMTLPDSEKPFFDAFSMAGPKERSKILSMIPKDQHHLYKAIWDRSDRGDPSLYVGSQTAASDSHLGSQFNNLQQHKYSGMMPSTDWIGWHEDVNIDDVEVKYIDNLGKDLHEYGYWHSAVRNNARKPYLEGSDDFLRKLPGPDPFSIAGQIFNAGRGPGVQYRSPGEASVSRLEGMMNQGHGNFYMNDDRSTEIMGALGAYGGVL
jgi:hypothetical protein